MDFHSENTREHILVCLSASPSNPKIVSTAARMADAFGGKLTALFVETGKSRYLNEEDQVRLKENMKIAEGYGAAVETVYGEDIALQIAEYARLCGATKVVIGRSKPHKRIFFEKQTFSERISELAPGIDVYIIPDASVSEYSRTPAGLPTSKLTWKDTIKALGIVILASFLGLLFQWVGFSDANIIMIYIMAVLLTAIVTDGRIYSIGISVISVLLFNFLFTEPFFTFHATGAEYPITFLVMFLTAFVISSLTTQIKRQAVHSTGVAYRTQILLDTNQLLQKEGADLMSVTANQLTKLLRRDIIYYPADKEGLGEAVWYRANEASQYQDERFRDDKERETAVWAFLNNKSAGSGTGHMEDMVYLYLPVRGEMTVFGVLAINMNGEALTTFENNLLFAILGECAMAMDKELFARKREEANAQMKNEQLRANLLRSISHDLRTPLTSISGNADMLIEGGDRIEESRKLQLYNDIYDDSMWLISLVENLLSITRIENGTMQLRMQTEVLEEVIWEAVSHGNRRNKDHHIVITPQEELFLVNVDVRLILQVLVNLIDNAVKHTAKGSEIVISTSKQDDMILVDVADNGPGIPDEKKEKIFEMFYTEKHEVVDGRRGMGLGLSLCRSIINAHGGTILVLDRPGGGTIFRFTLPVKEAIVHE